MKAKKNLYLNDLKTNEENVHAGSCKLFKWVIFLFYQHKTYINFFLSFFVY